MHSCEKKEHPSGNEAERTPTPPDGGWGWMVVFSSFMICVISDGIAYTFGIFYEEFLRDFKDSRGLTSWVTSTRVAATLFIGPAASKLTKMYGCRATTIIGSVWATTGLVTSTVVPNVPWLIFTAGICTGAYMSLRSVILIDVVGLDNVASAFGLTLAFGGTACLIGPPITGWLFDYSGSYDPGYFFSGTMIALSGLMLFFIPCAQRLNQSRDQKVVTARTYSSPDQATTTNISVI